MTTRYLSREQWQQLRDAGAVRVAILRSETPGRQGEPISCTYFDAAGVEVAHYFHEMLDHSGLVMYRRSWGGAKPEDRGYDVYHIDYNRHLP